MLIMLYQSFIFVKIKYLIMYGETSSQFRLLINAMVLTSKEKNLLGDSSTAAGIPF